MEERLAQRRDALLGRGAALFYQMPLHIVRGAGVAVFDNDGRRYVDMYNNVPCVGHCHPHVVRAISEQAATLNVHSRYLHDSIVTYAERLIGHHHDGIESVVFTCTGTEANEVALMMARLATNGRGIVCTDAAYHGNSAAVRRLTRPKDNAGDVRAIPFPETYRNAVEQPTAWYLERLREVIESFRRDDIPFAGMLVCPILANEGLPNIPPGFMTAAAQLVRPRRRPVHRRRSASRIGAHRALVGAMRRWTFDRTSSSWAKPLGAGVPLAGTAAKRDLVETFRRRTGYFNTFASSPLQAAAGSAVLDVIENENLRDNVQTVGAFLREELVKLQGACEAMGDVRGHGLFAGIEWGNG